MSYISAAQAKQIAQRTVDKLKDGTLVPKLADNLTPYAEDSGTTQTQPFFLEGTATGNGESRVDAKQVPAFAFLQEKRGNMVTVNQLADPSSYRESGSGTDCSFTCNGNKITLVVSNEISTNTVVSISTGAYWQIPAGHSYLYSTNNSNTKIRFRDGYSGANYSNIGIINKTGSKNVLPTLFLEAGLAAGTYIIIITISDLTQWFNGNIPAYLLSHPEAFGRYYKGSLAYEPGRLEPATGRYLTSVGRNLYDGEHDVEVSPSTRYYCSGLATITYKDVDGESIGDETVAIDYFDTPSNCYSIGISTQIPSLTITLYYPGESGYDKYYPHEVLATIDTGTESLYSAGSTYDSKVPSGLITRRIGSVDLGTLDWVPSASAENAFVSNDIADKIALGSGLPQNLSCSKYETVSVVTLAANLSDKQMTGNANGKKLIVKDTAYSDAATFKTAMSGVMLYYELATPTTEQGTPFQETIPIDDFGQLSWSDTDVPQGNQIFYPVDYKAYEDTLIKYTDGDATALALLQDIEDEETARSAADTILQNAIGGTLRQCLCVKESLDFDNTAFVDLGTLAWVKGSTTFYATVPDKANGRTNIICSKYSTAGSSQTDKTIVGNVSSAIVYIMDTAYDSMDATQFKFAMKGVLLAYEKA